MKFLAVLCLRPASRRPPHGGRGLKSLLGVVLLLPLSSPPARGAWIEIRSRTEWEALIHVAPRTGGVD